MREQYEENYIYEMYFLNPVFERRAVIVVDDFGGETESEEYAVDAGTNQIRFTLNGLGTRQWSGEPEYSSVMAILDLDTCATKITSIDREEDKDGSRNPNFALAHSDRIYDRLSYCGYLDDVADIIGWTIVGNDTEIDDIEEVENDNRDGIYYRVYVDRLCPECDQLPDYPAGESLRLFFGFRIYGYQHNADQALDGEIPVTTSLKVTGVYSQMRIILPQVYGSSIAETLHGWLYLAQARERSLSTRYNLPECKIAYFHPLQIQNFYSYIRDGLQ